MTDQTPEARLAAALWTAVGTHGDLFPTVTAVDTKWEVAAQRILAADPTLAADLALADKWNETIDRSIATTKATLDAWRRAEDDADRLAHSLRWLLHRIRNQPDSLDRRAARKALEMHDKARRAAK